MPDQSRYPLFHDGRFAFDEVHGFTWLDNELWLATEGAACAYDREKFRPRRFYARTLAAGAAELPRVREIARDPAAPAALVLRTAAGTAFRLDQGAWRPGDEAETFLRAYTRDTGPLLRWVQFPEGAIEAHTVSAGRPAVLGTKAGRSRLPLFSNNRFAFDDVRAAVLHGDTLWSATPAGLVEHQLNATTQSAPIVALHCFATDPGGQPVPMPNLERLVGLPDRALLAWGKEEVFFRPPPAGGGVPAWTVYPNVDAAGLAERMILPEGPTTWVLERPSEEGKALRVRRGAGGARAVSSSYQVADVTLAVMDQDWLYVPLASGGLLRVPKSRVR